MIEIALSISLITLFIHATTWDGLINDWVKKIIDPDAFWAKPLYGCPICMTPYYGTIIYFLMGFSHFLIPSFFGWLFTIAIASGFSTLIVIMTPDDN